MTTLVDTERITISPENVREAQAAVGAPHLAPLKLVLQAQDGSVISLPDHIENILLRTLQAVADDRHVAIGQLPSHLTSNAAADVLGVSRPTLMKWAKDGRIP
ncbi:MAG: helix-turn-helix domain-containing protein, partial [Propionibacteriaceae bacterium]